jgi:hypothetical protein
MAETIRIDASAHATLVEIARTKHLTLTEALSRAVEAYRRQEFFAGLAADYEALRADENAWTEELQDRNEWDATNADGLADE